MGRRDAAPEPLHRWVVLLVKKCFFIVNAQGWVYSNKRIVFFLLFFQRRLKFLLETGPTKRSMMELAPMSVGEKHRSLVSLETFGVPVSKRKFHNATLKKMSVFTTKKPPNRTLKGNLRNLLAELIRDRDQGNSFTAACLFL